MRIRKRFPFSSSMASSVSDPQLNSSTLVQQTSSLLHPIQNNDSQPSDPPNPHLSSDRKPMIITNTLQPHKFQINQKDEASRTRREQQEQNGSNNNNTSKEYNFLAVAPVGETGVSPPLGSYQVDGWFDGDEKVPLKKRKAQETMLMLEEKKMRPKMGSKTSKKSTSTSGMQQSHSEQDKAGNDDSSSTPNSSVKKMNKRGGVIMEGSRCSRVNGRGWRCCQQTLVGYSLCEHHLGKGRLRSISNVKARNKAPNTVVATTLAPQNESTTNDSTANDNQSSKNVLVPSSVVQPPVRDNKDTVLLDGGCYDDDDDEEEEEEEDEDANEDEDDDDYNEEETKKPLVVKKKRMKLGMVKARSLSSLLNQTN